MSRPPRYIAEGFALAYVPTTDAPQVIRNPEDAVKALSPLSMGESKREMFVAILTNARHEVLRVEVLSVGSLNASIVHPREVFKPAIIHSAASLVLAHNHPSGDPEPSEEDMSITRRLCEVGELVGISVLDHIIIGARGVVSFRARQLL